MAGNGAPRFGPDGQLLAELSDEGLEAELVRRRRRRGVGARTLTARPDEVVQMLANLELPPDASREEVERAYLALVARYQPFASAREPRRKAAAAKLLRSLKQARQGLLTHFDTSDSDHETAS